MTYTVKYGNMHVAALDKDMHERTCGYWYTVTSGATAHTAFTTKAGLLRWLDERGLTLDGGLPETRGEWASLRVVGEYYDASHGDFASDDYRDGMIEDDAWQQIAPVMATATLSNGDYTLALITEEDGIRTVHTLNPNVKTRVVYDRRNTAEWLAG